MSSRQFKRAMQQKMALEVLELDNSSSEEDSAPAKANAFAMFDSDTESEDESNEEDAHQSEKVGGDEEPNAPPPIPANIAKSDDEDTEVVEKVQTRNRSKKNQKKKRRGKNKKRGKGKNSANNKKANADAGVDLDFPDSSASISTTVESKEASAISAPISTTIAPAISSSTERVPSDTGASLAVNTRFLNDEYELKQVCMRAEGGGGGDHSRGWSTMKGSFRLGHDFLKSIAFRRMLFVYWKDDNHLYIVRIAIEWISSSPLNLLKQN